MMNLLENPIFVTYRRLAHRAGVWPMMLMVIVGGSALLYIEHRQQTLSGRGPSPSDIFYYFIILAGQALILVIPWMTQVSSAIVNERKDGLLETNWLTPLRPRELALGYLLGPPTGMLYAYGVSVPISLAVAFESGLSAPIWAATQVLILSTGLLTGLLGLAGGAVLKGGAGIGMAFMLFGLSNSTIAAGPKGLTNFILPIYQFAELLEQITNQPITRVWGSAEPRVFGVVVHGAILTAVAQTTAYIWLWVAARRKFADPDQRALTGWMTLALFAMLVIPQHALLWHTTEGKFPSPVELDAGNHLALIHIVTIVVALGMIATHALNPQRVRTEVLGGRYGGMPALFARSGVWLAIRLAVIAIAGFYTQCYDGMAGFPIRIVLPMANLFLAMVVFAMLVEVAGVWFGPRYIRVGLLGVFVLYLLPLIFFPFQEQTGDAWAFSLFVPGAYALGSGNDASIGSVKVATIAHAATAAMLFGLWWVGWSQWLERIVTPGSSHETSAARA